MAAMAATFEAPLLAAEPPERGVCRGCSGRGVAAAVVGAALAGTACVLLAVAGTPAARVAEQRQGQESPLHAGDTQSATADVDGGPALLWPRQATHNPASAALLAWNGTDACGSPPQSAGKVKWVEIIGGPPAPQPNFDWVARICTPLYPGPNCSSPVNWKGVVTLCVDGVPMRGVKMHTRGHVSKLFPKQQFSLTLPSAVGLLGMAPARKWVLATSFIDTSFQRNPLAFGLYRQMGGWATETRYVNLQWHGQHLGLFYIGERIERGPGRLQVPESREHDAKKSGYLLTVDWQKAGTVCVESRNTSTFFSFLYPKHLSDQQKSFTQQLVNEVDTRAAAPGGEGHLEQVLDFASFARFFVLEELAKDVDGYAFSDFMMIKNGKLMHAAPWDFDLSFGYDCQSMYFKNFFTGEDTSRSVAGWNVENVRDGAIWIGPTGLPGGTVWRFGLNKRRLFLNIWQHRGFRRAFASAWRAARAGPLSDGALRSSVQSRAELVAAAAAQDMRIWRGTARCAFFPCCSPPAAQDFRLATRLLRETLLGRARWIDAHVGTLLA